MTGSPYLPPEAPVADPPRAAIGRPPWPVVVAIVCIVLLALVLGLQFMGLMMLRERIHATATSLATPAVEAAVTIMLAWFLARGRAWSRWVLVAIVLLQVMGAISKFAYFARHSPTGLHLVPFTVTIWLVPSMLSLIALAMVFGPGRAWFRR